MDSWKLITGSGTHGVAIANYRPEQTNELNEEFRTLHLQILVGDVVSLEEECNEWYLGRVISNPGMIGVFPKSFIHTYTETKEDLPIVAEIGKIDFIEFWSQQPIIRSSNIPSNNSKNFQITLSFNSTRMASTSKTTLCSTTCWR